MCFAPKQRSLFRHLNFQKWSEPLSFSHFWLGNVLRASTASTFSTSELPKVVQRWGVCSFSLTNVLRAATACNFSSLIWPAGSAPAALAPSWAPNHWKHTVNRDFPTFSRTCIFLLLTLSLVWSSHFFSSPPWLFPPLLFHLSILSEVWLLNFLRSPIYHRYPQWQA